MFKSLENIIATLQETWNGSPEFQISRAFVYFFKDRAKESKYLTYGFLNELARSADIHDPDAVSRVVQNFLQLHLLEMRFEVHDEEDNAYPVNEELVWEAKRTGIFISPLTGNAEEDFESKLFVYFVPSREIVELFEARRRTL